MLKSYELPGILICVVCVALVALYAAHLLTTVAAQVTAAIP